MTMLNLETSYPEHVSRIEPDRRVEINFDGRAMRLTVCTFEPGRAERRKSCWTLREAANLADRELERIRAPISDAERQHR